MSNTDSKKSKKENKNYKFCSKWYQFLHPEINKRDNDPVMQWIELSILHQLFLWLAQMITGVVISNKNKTGIQEN